ncbi:hypothetical protein N7507_010193 [Penicillium longicatenatum]|nr:hypothetical protein N7507_010193 [Penicillium longicatenatum]
MAFSDRIFQYCWSEMPPSGIPERSLDTPSPNVDMSITSQQQQPTWQTVDRTVFSSSPDTINTRPNSGSVPNASSQCTHTLFSVMRRAVPLHQEQTIRQLARPPQTKEQGYTFASQTTLPTQIPPWDYADFLACGEHYKSHQPPPSERLKCDWKGCRYTGTFGRKAELKRHVDTQHISPRAYKCPKCGRPHNRDDNMNGHLRRVHGSDIQADEM